MWKLKPCPRCKKEDLELFSAGPNGYVGYCKTCVGLIYYCSLLQRAEFLPSDKEYFDVSFDELEFCEE